MHSNDVQSLNGVETLLQEELGERVPASFDFDMGCYRGNKQVWMCSDNDVKEFLRSHNVCYGAWEGAQRKKGEIIEIAQKSQRHVMQSKE